MSASKNVLKTKDQFNLKLRFQVGLGIILFCFCLFTTTIIYHFQKNLLEEESFRKTELVMTLLESTRSYIREVLRPRMYKELGKDRFIIEAMSTSYITRVVMDRFKSQLPDFKYRRTAIDARNPSFEADVQEKEMIDYFIKYPQEQEWHGMTKLNSGAYYTLYRPIVFNSSCLRCHGNPENAPATIKKIYGEKRGFFRKPDVITGIVSISVPIDTGLAQIKKTSFRMFGAVIVLALLLYGSIWLFFNQLIITSLRDLITLFRTTIDDGDKGALPEKLRRPKEELKELFNSAEILVTRLRNSRSKLVEYTDNLEVIVAERTEALKRSENQARSLVKQRNRELMLHNSLTGLITSTETRQTILNQVLLEALQVIPAIGAGIYLYDEKRENLILQCAERAPMLEKQIKTGNGTNEPFQQASEITCDHIQIIPSDKHNLLNISIPLCCRNRLLGKMIFTELPCEALNDALQGLLLSIGQQIGISTESLQNMQNLRRSTHLLQSVFDGISDPLILLDPDGTLQMVNQAFLIRHNLNKDEATGRPIETVASQQQCLFSNRLRECGLQAKEPHTEEVQLDDGSIFDVYFYPILNRDNSVHAIVCFAKDVTAVKETERRIQQTEKLVAVGQLAAGVAHEINNPLGVILCYTDIIKENNIHNEGIIADIEVIERHTENCRRIVADLLDFSHSKGSRIDKQHQSVNETIENVLLMIRQQFLKRRINLESNLDKNIPRCLIDSRRMKQVLLNLLMNSGQAIENGGNISIVSRMKNGQVIIEIDDDGPGIDKAIMDKIFDPFFSTKEPGQGTGLGLSVSYGIVREHDGEIMVQSTVGQGTRFTISLPVPEKDTDNE